MKNLTSLLLLFSVLLSLAVSSCGKKDEPTGADVGSGTVTATVDGKNWSSKNTIDGAVYGESQGTHTISGYGADNSFISLAVLVPVSAGQTYTATNGALSAQYKPSLAGPTAYITAGTLGSGSVTFSEYSSSKVKGSFQFTGILVDQNGGQTPLKVENGAFEFNL